MAFSNNTKLKPSHPLYTTWHQMRQRCYNKNHTSYSHYGGRGIKISNEWHRLGRFVEDMGERPEGMTLDRIDSSKGYCKDNCRWSTKTAQSLNQRVHKNNKLGVRGVEERRNRFRARTHYKGKLIHIGMFDTALEASQAYDKAVIELIAKEAIA